MKLLRLCRRALQGVIAATVAAVSVVLVPASSVSAAPEPAATAGSLSGIFTAAADEFKVPPELLLALSYDLSGWNDREGLPSADGGYGPMHLTDAAAIDVTAESGKERDRTALSNEPARNTLRRAAKLLNVDPTELKVDDRQNVRGGAALLAEHAKSLNHGALPGSLAGWYSAVAMYPGTTDRRGATAFADDVFSTLRKGATAHRITLKAAPKLSPPRDLTATSLREDAKPLPKTECPSDSHCRFVPAAYQQTDPNDPAGYGNYDPADRPADGNRIRYIVIHDTESSYDSTINAAQDPTTKVASHYVIRSHDGEITQMLRTRDVGWHSANWNINSQSIGIEHEGFVAEGRTWFTEAMYRSSAKLVRYLAKKYHIPMDRNHILGHEDVTRSSESGIADAHYDPGAFWNWDHYMSLVTGKKIPKLRRVTAGQVVELHPGFATNKNKLRDCQGKAPCQDLPEQGSNFVFLRTQPRDDAPYVNDPYLQPNGAAGTDMIQDWSDKAVAGRRYVVAEVRGDWVALWWGGKQAWLKAPPGTTLSSVDNPVIRLKDDEGTARAYTKAQPQPEDYPPGVPIDGPLDKPVPISKYTLSAGQAYPVAEETPAQDYYARFDGANVPHNHTLVRGNEVFYLISYNHRYVYVSANDVTYGSR